MHTLRYDEGATGNRRWGHGTVTRWLRRNADAGLALLVAVVVGTLAVVEVLGADQVNAAILLVLALLAATLLQDRKSAAQALTSASAVRLLGGLEVSQEHAEARRATEQWIFKGGTGTLSLIHI